MTNASSVCPEVPYFAIQCTRFVLCTLAIEHRHITIMLLRSILMYFSTTSCGLAHLHVSKFIISGKGSLHAESEFLLGFTFLANTTAGQLDIAKILWKKLLHPDKNKKN